MNLQLLRNATLVLSINGKTILIDPMLGKKGSYDPIINTANSIRNPTVDLPINDQALQQLINSTDAVLLTHLHRDHWDETAQQLLPKHIPVYASPIDVNAILQSGFNNVIPVEKEIQVGKVQIIRTDGHHGKGEIETLLGKVCGYVIIYEQQRIYIAGDTIWCDEVAQAIDKYKPNHIILNGGGARFNTGDPIIMDIKDILTVCHYAPIANIYVVHLESVNHITESRADIKAALQANGFEHRAHVPDNGEVFL
ncbi:L-ascorbate metabolism protein UlaG (beta-lactamase superfamily) [Mucilaginibacter yixingensis]|uniref:L-ascorbate metabolism protein UlaG (Beta-lactamase superfamily) n=1 Tax=Mucilaginibacter yixingensis TaxID=1295612 RepID=A0A2T5J4N5_9SPHI|nr:MBL fold metallo-hydrolase [Mucilaginibacter yixingensis]PTQ92630.1 L-ascorbate metabolism protein UlaG (beta-lactamase superfamily) [Mucilaginibacter yixingensis]